MSVVIPMFEPRCRDCGRSRDHIAAKGHGPSKDYPQSVCYPCNEACTCIPQHFTLEEHDEDERHGDAPPRFKLAERKPTPAPSSPVWCPFPPGPNRACRPARTKYKGPRRYYKRRKRDPVAERQLRLFAERHENTRVSTAPQDGV